MARKISRNTRLELLEVLKQRYMRATKKEKSRILDEFAALTGYHRKHVRRLLGNQFPTKLDNGKQSSCRRIYDEAVKEALIVAWEVSDRICGKRLKAILPNLVDALERHRHIDLDLTVRQRLLSASAATIDRLLSDVRKQAGTRNRHRRKPKKVSAHIPIRTFADWVEPLPGCLE